jgi:hypothetical protein
MSFTWNELVGLGIIKFLRDPELVLYFLKILGPRRRDFLDDEYRSSYYKWALHGWPDHRISSLKTIRMIPFFREDSILIHPMVDWRKGKMSYEEANTYFLNGGTYSGCRSATLEEKIYSIKNLLTESLIQCVDAVEGAHSVARQVTLLMIDGGPGEGMPDPLPIPLVKVELELRII